MRALSSDALAKIAQQKGVEPVNIAEIQWHLNGAFHRYSDKSYPEYSVEGRIAELSNLENVVNISKNGSSQSISLKLEDVDGALKAIYNNTDIHKRRVLIYQWFTGLDYSDRFLIFEGVISSPIVWNAGDRTLSFDIVSQLEDHEIGFSAEEGKFDLVPDELMGRAWPLPFGRPLKIPCLKLDPIPSGLTLDGDGIDDESIEDQKIELTRAINMYGGLASLAFSDAILFYYNSHLDEDGAYQLERVNDHFESLGDQATDKGNQYLSQQYEAQQDLANLTQVQNEQKTFGKSELRIYNGSHFPQGQSMQTSLDGVIYSGQMVDDKFQVTDKQREGTTGTLQQTQNLTIDLTSAKEVSNGTLGGTSIVQKLGFKWLKPGLSFKMLTELPVRYIAAMLPCAVLRVYGRRNFKDNKVMMALPASYYNISTQNFGSITATIVTLKKPLSYYEKEEWDDELFVDLISPVGPNTVDILEWLIQTYTNLGIDEASFNSVRNSVSNFRSDFCLFERKNIVDALHEIAYRARCAIWLKNGVFYLRYLPKEPAPVDTITKDDIIFGSFQIDHTLTEEIVTKLTAEYRVDYAQEKPFKYILRHNVKKYGVQEENTDWYIYNRHRLVDLAATFWLIRKSNTWKIIRFKTPLHKLNLETFDAVTINISDNWSHNGAVTGIIESVKYDSSNSEIEFEVWLPVRLGEMTKYNFAWPIDSKVTLFPTTADFPGGDGPGADADGDLEPTNGAERAAPSTSIKKTGSNLDHGNNNPGDENPDVSIEDVPQPGDLDATPEPFFEYKYRNYQAEPYNSSSGIYKERSLPGLIVSKGEAKNVYKVDVYPNGLSGETSSVNATVVEDKTNLTPGTWVTVITIVWTIKVGDKIVPKSQNVIVPAIPGPSTFPGKVTGGSGATINMQIYRNGTAGEATNVTGVKVMQIDSGETIPVNTWLPVIEIQKTDPETGQATPEYYVQPAIWYE